MSARRSMKRLMRKTRKALKCSHSTARKNLKYAAGEMRKLDLEKPTYFFHLIQ